MLCCARCMQSIEEAEGAASDSCRHCSRADALYSPMSASTSADLPSVWCPTTRMAGLSKGFSKSASAKQALRCQTANHHTAAVAVRSRHGADSDQMVVPP